MSAPLLPPSDLMNRLQSFLPKLAASNLAIKNGTEKFHVLDDCLNEKPKSTGAKDNSKVNDNDDEEEKENDSNDDGDNDGEGEMIELDVALGDFDDSMVAKLEDAKDQEEDEVKNNDDDSDSEDEDQEEDAERIKTTKRALSSIAKDDEITKSNKKKVLIQEIE